MATNNSSTGHVATNSSSSNSASKSGSKDFELPPAILSKILKSKLPEGYAMSKEAKQAFSKATGLFILYITSCANDFCREKKKHTITAENVLQSLEELEFGELVPNLKEYLSHIRSEAEKNKEAAKAIKSNTLTSSNTDDANNNNAEQPSSQDQTKVESTSLNVESNADDNAMETEKSKEEENEVTKTNETVLEPTINEETKAIISSEGTENITTSANEEEEEAKKTEKMEVEEEKTEYAAL